MTNQACSSADRDGSFAWRHPAAGLAESKANAVTWRAGGSAAQRF